VPAFWHDFGGGQRYIDDGNASSSGLRHSLRWAANGIRNRGRSIRATVLVESFAVNMHEDDTEEQDLLSKIWNSEGTIEQAEQWLMRLKQIDPPYGYTHSGWYLELQVRARPVYDRVQLCPIGLQCAAPLRGDGVSETRRR